MEEEMEAIKELMMKKNKKQHVCKFCSKSFPCGRSLGGHMRSHLIVLNNSKTTISTSTRDSIINGEVNKHQFDHQKQEQQQQLNLEDDALLGNKKKLCKECGKVFLSSKALFGHMKSHSENYEKPSSSSINHNHVNTSSSLLVAPTSPVHHDSWTTTIPINNNNNQNEHSESENEAAADIPIPRPKRSIRKPRYIGGITAATTTTSSSSLSLSSAANINVAASSPVSDIEQEQREEEVALSLIMLSKDLSQWNPRAGAALFNSSTAHEPSSGDHPSSAPRVDHQKKTKKKRIRGTSVCTAGGQDVMKKVQRNKFHSDGKKKLQVEISSHVNVSKAGRIEDKGDDNGIINDEVAVSLRKNMSCTSFVSTDHEFDHHHYGGSSSSTKRKVLDDVADQLVIKNSASATLDHDGGRCRDDMNILMKQQQEVETDKRSKFECTTCNKVFYSYQALGGHRASHNKLKGSCSTTIITTSPKKSAHLTKVHDPETTEIENSPPPPAPAPAPASLSSIERATEIDHDKTFPKKKIPGLQKHECPICFKVFPSGQALGGHKRSHVIANRNTMNYSDHMSNTIHDVIQKQQSPTRIRDFLDLNFPPPVSVVEDEEETTSAHDVVGFKSWWAALEPARGTCGGNLQLIINGQEKS